MKKQKKQRRGCKPEHQNTGGGWIDRVKAFTELAKLANQVWPWVRDGLPVLWPVLKKAIRVLWPGFAAAIVDWLF